MYREGKVGAVILAAGRSNRMGNGVNKVYREVLDRPVLVHSINSFIGSGIVDEIVVVFNEGEESLLRGRVLEPLEEELTGLSVKCVEGGEKRQGSSRAGLEVSDSVYVCIHDGARPNFSSDLIVRLLEATVEHGAAFPGIKPVDTIRADDDGFAGETVDRNSHVKVQTPQCFKRELLLDAIYEAEERNRYFTDDAGVVMALDRVKPKIVQGERGNMKLTTPEDVQLIKVLMSG